MYQFKCMCNQFCIMSPYCGHLVIFCKYPLCRGFPNSEQLPKVDIL